MLHVAAVFGLSSLQDDAMQSSDIKSIGEGNKQDKKQQRNPGMTLKYKILIKNPVPHQRIHNHT